VIDDFLNVGGTNYDGTNCPQGVTLSGGTTIRWTSDGSVAGDGWQVCASTSGGGSSSNADGYGTGEAPALSVPAPVDCVGGWGTCTHACSRAFEIHTPASDGGRACSLAAGTVDATGCNPGDGSCPGGASTIPPSPTPSLPAPDADTVIGVICGSTSEQGLCYQQTLRADAQGAPIGANQEVRKPRMFDPNRL
jgi:hypothetical protein